MFQKVIFITSDVENAFWNMVPFMTVVAVSQWFSLMHNEFDQHFWGFFITMILYMHQKRAREANLTIFWKQQMQNPWQSEKKMTLFVRTFLENDYQKSLVYAYVNRCYQT